MTMQPDPRQPDPTQADAKLTLLARLTLVGLGAAALALAGAGLAYASDDGDGTDSAWVTVVEDDGSGASTRDCPEHRGDDGGGL